MKLARWLIFKVFIIQTPNIQFPCCFPRKKDTESDSPWTNKHKTNNKTGPQPEIKKNQLKCFTALLPRKPRGILWIPTCWDVYSSCTSPLKTRSQRWSAFGSAPCKKGAANGRMVPPPKSKVKCVVYETPVCSSIMFDISAINIYLAILIGYSFEYMNLWSLNVQRCIYLHAMLRSPTAELRQVAKVRELTTCQVVKAVLEQES